MSRVALAVIIVLVVAATLAAAAAPQTTTQETRPAEPGERCILCSRPLGPDDVARMIRGRWVAVHAGPCEGTLEEDPQAAFASLQPKGALFQEEFTPPPALGWGWFLLGAYVLLGLGSAAWCGHLAYPRRRSPALWFAAGLAFNLLAVAALALSARKVEAVPPHLGRIQDTADPLPCPACGAENHPSARRCAGCGAALAPRVQAEAARAL